MKGKKVLWLMLTAMLLSMIVNVGTSPATKAKVRLDPERIPEPGQIGHPGDEYVMSVEIDKVVDLYAFGFTVQYAPYVSVLVASDINEGDFLSEGGVYATGFAKKISPFAGTIKVGATRLGLVPGASGSGTLVTFKFTVREAGESPIRLLDVVLKDRQGELIPVQTENSHYYGKKADLVRVEILPGRKVAVGENLTFRAKVRSESDEPLVVRVRFDIERMDDGRRIQLYSGQTYLGGGLGEPLPFEYIYLDEFNLWHYEWKNPASYALGTPDGSYIEGDANGQWASLYSFEDISLSGRAIAYAEIEGYSQYPNGATEDVDIDLYAFTSNTFFGWLGSNYGTDTWGWHGVRWTNDKVTDVVPEIRTEGELNGLELLIYNYHGNTPNIIRVDSVRLKAFFASIVPPTRPDYLLQPFEEIDLEAHWIAKQDHIGTYSLTATCEFTQEWLARNEGAKTQTRSFEITP